MSGRDAHKSLLATRLMFFQENDPTAQFPGAAWQRLRR